MLAWVFVVACNVVYLAHAEDFELRMPDVIPQTDDLYLCTVRRAPEETFVTGYVPHGSMKTAHHILVYGCETPGGGQNPVWNCGEMQSSQDTGFEQGPVCGPGESKIIYAWAKDAPALNLPKGVGFKVGDESSGIQYLVLQVHYMHGLDHEDDSGVTLKTTEEPQPKQAGVLLLGTGGGIPAGGVTNMDVACAINEDVKLHPFAFRTHTHKLGKEVLGYRVREGKWDLIGKHNPQEPQMFYTSEDTPIQQGDMVAARCIMDNQLDHPVYMGATGEDEMCNFYMMYWVDGDGLLSQTSCFSPGYPNYSWKMAGLKAPKGVDGGE